jgi:[acyl-carrier-protein] S-malonyltransferase
MGAAAARVDGGMLALVGADARTVDDAIRIGSAHGVVELAAHNAPDEWVLTGELQALDAIAPRWPSRRLEVDGPWHSRLMAGAEREFRAACSRVDVAAPTTRFHANRTGAVVRDPEKMAELVSGQLTRPLRWVETIEAMGVQRFLIAGPGRVLRGTVRKILGATADIRVLETPADLGAMKEYQR